MKKQSHMLARHWRGWTTPENADAYEHLLRSAVFPGLQKLPGYLGCDLLRRDHAGEVEFVVINFFESLDAVRFFAGADYETAVFEPEALQLLSRKDSKAMHYEVRLEQRS